MEFFYNDFSGGINLALSKTRLGFNTKQIFWSDSQNVEILQNKGIVRQKGNVLFLQLAQEGQITGLFDYHFENRHVLLITTSLGNFYSYDKQNDVLKLEKSGLYGNYYTSFVRFLDGVVVSNGHDLPFYFDFSLQTRVQSCNATDTNNFAIKGSAIASFKGRLWIASGKTLYFSALGKYNDWITADDAGYISNFYSDSAEILSIAPYKNYLVIYKENQTYLLTGNNNNDFAISNFADKGSVSHYSVVNFENKQYFYNGGVFCLDQSGELNQLQISSEITDVIKPALNNCDKNRSDKVITLLYRAKNQVWFFIPHFDNSYLNLIWIYDFQNKAWFKRKVPQNITFATVFDEQILLGTDNSKILIDDFSDKFESEPVNFYWKSPFFPLNNPNERKTIDEMWLITDNSYDNKFKLNIYNDFDDINMASTDNIYCVEDNVGFFDFQNIVWDCISRIYIFAINTQTSVKSEVMGSNYSFQLEVRGSLPDENFALLALNLKEVYKD